MEQKDQTDAPKTRQILQQLEYGPEVDSGVLCRKRYTAEARCVGFNHGWNNGFASTSRVVERTVNDSRQGRCREVGKRSGRSSTDFERLQSISKFLKDVTEYCNQLSCSLNVRLVQ